MALGLAWTAAACGSDEGSGQDSAPATEAASQNTTPSSAAPANEGFCSHVDEGVAPAPERRENGHVSFVFTDGDDTEGVLTTVQVTRGPGESAADQEVTGQYCDWEQQTAECVVTNGRAIPYSRAEEFDLDHIIDQEEWERYDGIRIKLALPDAQFATALFIRDRDTVISLLDEC